MLDSEFACQAQFWATLGSLQKEMKTAMLGRNGTFAFARMFGGMILSGPSACRGSMKEARILPVFLHSPAEEMSATSSRVCVEVGELTAHRRGQRIIETETHLGGFGLWSI